MGGIDLRVDASDAVNLAVHTGLSSKFADGAGDHAAEPPESKVVLAGEQLIVGCFDPGSHVDPDLTAAARAGLDAVAHQIGMVLMRR